jgi:DNA-binding transcriptional MerR regulator
VASASTELTIEDLADQVGVSVRTVRYYIGQGLLAGPGTRGRAAAYGEEHLARLRLIRRLSEQHVPLAEQRRRLEGLSLAEVQGLLGDEERRERELKRAEGARSPREYVAGLLARARAGRDEQPLAPERAQPVGATKPRMSESSIEAKPRGVLAPVSPSPAPARFRKATAALEAAGAPESTGTRSPVAEDWQKWQLAPGIELHVRKDVVRDHSRLVERLLETAREAPGRDPGLDAAFPPGGSTHDD